MRALHENPDCISHLLTLKAHITKSCMFFLSAEICKAFSTNSVDPDQTEQSDLGPLCLPLYILMLTNKQTFSNVVILLAL